MELFKFVVGQIVDLESHEWKAFKDQLSIHEFKKGTLLSLSGKVPEEVFFIESIPYISHRKVNLLQITRVILEDNLLIMLYRLWRIRG